jgi:hypothetical protein
MPLKKRIPLPVKDISCLRLPLEPDRFSGVLLDDVPDKEFSRPPNELVRVGDIHWLQDTANDSFSDEQSTSIWQTLSDIVAEQQVVYRSRSAPSGIPTLICHKVLPDGHWYALDTRRTLVYKIVFHPDQRIPVHSIPHSPLVDVKMNSHRWSPQRAGSVWLRNRLHEHVPYGLQSLPFIRNKAQLAGLECHIGEADGSQKWSCEIAEEEESLDLFCHS